jgi:hypothetical protein
MTKFGDVLTTDDMPAGTTILNGSGVPADALGAVGNYYLDTVAKILYGPKSSSSFGPDQLPVTATPTQTGQISNATIGSKFKTLVAGQIRALRFYQVTGNATAYVVTLLVFGDPSGTELGRCTISVPGGASAGWASAVLPTPVGVTANTNYRVGYSFSAPTYLMGYTPSYTPTSSVPAAVTINGGCSASGTTVYPNGPDSNCYFADIVFQAAQGPWPVAIKSAP